MFEYLKPFTLTYHFYIGVCSEKLPQGGFLVTIFLRKDFMSDYKDYNNYSQRDKESMRTYADDKLVEQTDDVESKLTSIDSTARTIKSDVTSIKSNTASISTSASNIFELLDSKRISVFPESITMQYGDLADFTITGLRHDVGISNVDTAVSQAIDGIVAVTRDQMDETQFHVSVASAPQNNAEGYVMLELTVGSSSEPVYAYVGINVVTGGNNV